MRFPDANLVVDIHLRARPSFLSRGPKRATAYRCDDLEMIQAFAIWAHESNRKRFMRRARGETHDEIYFSARRTGERIAIRAGINRVGRFNGFDALCHHVAIHHHRNAARRHPIDVVREIWRVIHFRFCPGGQSRTGQRASLWQGPCKNGAHFKARCFFFAHVIVCGPIGREDRRELT